MSDSLKRKTVSGVVWSAIERFSTQGVQFVIEIAMARVLLPSDYGMIGMLAIFLAISRSFIDSGFSNALIQKKNVSENDFSTVFYFNIIIAVLFYGLIYCSAPLIARFYDMPDLILVTRVISLTLIISSFSIVSRTILVIEVNFKTQAKISLYSAIISGVIGVCLAYNNYGVWALVWQSLINYSLQTILFFIYLRWHPTLVFSIESFKSLFSFGSKLLMATLLGTIYENLYTIVIGKKYKATELGYYTKSEQLVKFPSTNIAGIISRVSFPILSKIQDDNIKLKTAYEKYLSLSSYVIFPLMLGIGALTDPLIRFVLTDEWIGMVLIFQILILDWVWDPICKININLLLVKGLSNLVLRLEIIKRIISISILVISMLNFGIIGICVGRVIYSLISVYLNSYYTGKQINGLNYWNQMKIIMPYFIVSLVMSVVVWGVSLLVVTPLAKLLLGGFVGVAFYLFISCILKLTALSDLLLIIKEMKNEKNKR